MTRRHPLKYFRVSTNGSTDLSPLARNPTHLGAPVIGFSFMLENEKRSGRWG